MKGLKALLLFVVVLIYLVSPVYAETGTITLPNETTLNFNGVASGNTALFNITFHNISVDFHNFSQLDTFDMNWSTGAITNPNVMFVGGYNQTTFTITQCGSGSGVAIKSPVTLRFVWYFNKPNTITCSPIVLSYAQEIFDNNNFYLRTGATAAYAGRDTSTYLVDNNQPILVFINKTGTTNNRDMVIGGTLLGSGFPAIFNEIVDTNAIIKYNITYPHSNTFVTSIDKSPTLINTKVIIQNASGTPINYPNQVDTTFNNNNYSVDNTYGQGIALNVTIPGNFVLTTINASGSNIVVPTPTPTPITTLPTPGTANYIIPDSVNYSLGDISTLFWGIDSSLFNSLRQIDIDILRPDGTYDSNNFQNLATDSIVTGQVNYQVIQSGTYTAYLNTCLITCFGISPANKVHLATTTLNVSSPQPFIIAPSQVLANQRFNITYSYDTNLTSQVSFGYIAMQKAGQGSFEQFQAATIDTSIHTISNATLHTEGTYTLCLGNTGKNTGVCTSVQVVVGSLPPTANITTSNITLSKSTYMWGESLRGNYGIDNRNYSRTDGATLFWDIYNTDLGVETMSGFIGTQTEHFSLLISNDNHYLWDGKNVVLDSFFQNGNNQFRIFAQNSTTITQIVNGTFFLGEVNTNGYGIKPDVSTTTQNTAFHILVTSPTSGKVVLIPLADVTQEQEFLINGSIVLTTALSVEGVATMYLYDNIGNQEATNQINITVNPNPPNPSSPFAPSSPEQGAVGVLDGWVSMFNLGINGVSRFLFALIVTVIFMLAGALVTRNLGWGTLFGIIPFVFFAFIGYYPLLIDALVVIAIGLKLRFL